MSKLKNPLLSLGAIGRLAKNLVFLRRRKVNIVESRPVPEDAKSLAQLSWRHMYLKAIALWHALSASEKQEWESLARTKHMTGFAWFISQALKPNPGLYLPLQGGTMAGNIDMASHLLQNLLDPTNPQDPVTLIYLLSVLNFLSLTDTPASYAGQALKLPRVNAAEDALEFATVVGGYTEGARVYHSIEQTLPSATYVTLAFDSENYDTDAIHDPITNNSRLTCKTAGKYLIIGQVAFATNTSGRRALVLRINGVTVIAYTSLLPCAAAYSGLLTSAIYNLNLNDYVELEALQDSGIPLNVMGYTHFEIQRIG